MTSTASWPLIRYFDALYEQSLVVIDKFPITNEPPAMVYVTGVLEPFAEKLLRNSGFSDPDHGLQVQIREIVQSASSERKQSVGLNTVGMLLDRFSIMALKHWNLVNRRGDPSAAELLRATQIRELVLSLALALPGYSSVNNKLTKHQSLVGRSSFCVNYGGLLTVNLLLWEAQEILYNHDIERLTSEELRGYISFFSRGNVKRNSYIQAVDQSYWSFLGERY